MSNLDTVYYNANLICRKNYPTDPDLPCKYSENRSDILLDNANLYKFSIIRASFESVNIPILIPKIDTTQGNINQTSYQVQLSCNLTINAQNYTIQSNPINVMYQCRNKFANQVPASPLNRTVIEDPYYYIYDVNHFVDLVNTAFVTAQASLLTNGRTQIQGLNLVTKCPKMVYENNLFTIYFDSNGYGGTDATSNGGAQVENCYLTFNDAFFSLFRNFNTILMPNGFYQVNVQNSLNNIVTVGTKQYYTMTQSFQSLSNIWSPVSSIVFYSNMGIRTEYLGSFQVLNGINQVTTSSNNIEQNIADIILPLDNTMEYNSLIVYQPTKFRYSDVTVNQIRNVDISIYWKSKNGSINPVTLADGCSMSVKMMFKKKI